MKISHLLSGDTGRSGWRTLLRNKWGTLARNTGVLSSEYLIIAMLLNTGGIYVLYLTPLYIASFSHPYLHHLIHFHFLAAGYLFSWSLIGLDPAPKRPGLQLRMLILFISIAAHAF
ncbi:cytochrome c oxidase assembly protein, partial [Pedobacter sp.]|uniref:cytochrome c oxidase assembly protein n=1 Tax=Pedobacter sp. TaxID=1411316 RepID=UPI003D7FE302